MSRSKLLIDNMLIYGLGSILSKIVPFIMIPIVTRMMPNTEYFGLSDMTNTIVSFAQAFAIMGMYDALFRMYFDEKGVVFKQEVCSTALLFVIGNSIVIALCMCLFSDPVSRIFFGTTEYISLVFIAALSTVIGGSGSILQAPTRMQNKRLVFIVVNLLSSILTYGISVLLLMTNNYVLALPLGFLSASTISSAIFFGLNKSSFSLKRINFSLLKQMLIIGIPLMPTFLCYWVFSSVDKVMIVNYLGTGEEGIYAAAAMIGQASQLIYTAFSQGWQYFAFSTMNDEDQVEMTSKIYEYLGIISFAATALLMALITPLFGLFFPSEYANGVSSAPYLFLAPLTLMLFQILSNQLLVIKKTWPSFLLLLGGAIFNIILNLILIPMIGIEGAAIATLTGYTLSNIAAYIVLSKMNLIKVERKFFLGVLVFAAYFLVWRIVLFGNTAGLLLVCVIFYCIIAIIYKKEITNVMKKTVNRFNQKDN